MTWLELLQQLLALKEAGLNLSEPAKIAILRGERTWTLATSYDVNCLAQSPRGNVYILDTPAP